MQKPLIAIVPAAGIGTRANNPDNLPKQYRLIGGITMLRRTVLALLAEPRIQQIRVAVASNDTYVENALAGLPRTVWRFCGGPSRADTVRQALLDANLADDTWVMVHDAARPGLPAASLTKLIDSCWVNNTGGILALPVADTIKKSEFTNGQTTIANTVDRKNMWQAQTPQMFLATDLISALNQCVNDTRVTDEASAIELSSNKPILLVNGARQNFKLTYPADFTHFEKFYLNQL